MKNQLTENAKADVLKSVLDRLNTHIIRACVLNLIAQVTLDTPMAAHAQGNPQPALTDRQKEIGLALSACPDSAAWAI